jgi:hypothetical protein
VIVVGFRKGVASFLFCGGGGTFGGGGQEEIKKAAIRLVETSVALIPQMRVAPDREVVRRGMFRVYVLLPDKVLMEEVKIGMTVSTESPLGLLYQAAQNVISGFRKLETKSAPAR